MLVVTHYQRLLNYIVPDFVHVLTDGRIVRSGGKELALELEDKGYGWIEPPSRGAPERHDAPTTSSPKPNARRDARRADPRRG